MSTGRNDADMNPQTCKEPYISSDIATARYDCSFKTNKFLAIHISCFLGQMSPEFVCLMATALQWHLHTHVATGKAVQVLLCNSMNTGSE